MKHKAENVNEPAKAYDYGVYLLGIKLRTEGEMRQRMAQKGFSVSAVEEALRQLVAQRYVNDRLYAETYVENLKKYKTFGWYGVKKKLLEKRLPKALVDEVMSAGFLEAEEAEIAKRFLAKQKPGLEKQKLAQRLAARGFKSSVIVSVVI